MTILPLKSVPFLFYFPDGLLWDLEEIELEALSNKAIILLLEMGKTD